MNKYMENKSAYYNSVSGDGIQCVLSSLIGEEDYLHLPVVVAGAGAVVGAPR